MLGWGSFLKYSKQMRNFHQRNHKLPRIQFRNQQLLEMFPLCNLLLYRVLHHPGKYLYLLQYLPMQL